MRIEGMVVLSALAGLMLSMAPRDASACTLEDCGSLPSSCYNLNGVRWCQITKGNNPPFGHWTPVNSYNHSSYGAAVKQSWKEWNAPPNGPTNSLYLYSDNKNNANHDIDYWDTYEVDWWWGFADYPGGVDWNTGCINRGGGRVVLNTYGIPNDWTLQLWLAEHETGHAFGMGHACVCPQVMNPCSGCYNADLSNCDGKGARQLYH
ncbi:MAG: hypothetical protein ABI939_12645 [Anaerolineaceae bacterium]